MDYETPAFIALWWWIIFIAIMHIAIFGCILWDEFSIDWENGKPINLWKFIICIPPVGITYTSIFTLPRILWRLLFKWPYLWLRSIVWFLKENARRKRLLTLPDEDPPPKIGVYR